MGVVYKDGTIKDYHDDGKQARELINEMEVRVAIHQLTPISRKIITLRLEGFTNAEIMAKLKVSQKKIATAVKDLHQVLNR